MTYKKRAERAAEELDRQWLLFESDHTKTMNKKQLKPVTDIIRLAIVAAVIADQRKRT